MQIKDPTKNTNQKFLNTCSTNNSNTKRIIYNPRATTTKSIKLIHEKKEDESASKAFHEVLCVGRWD